jgi:regulator of sigma E protease
MTQAFSIVVSIAAILMVGNLLILAHELGHYTAARSVGLVAERFTVGFGPNLFRVTDCHGTLWSLSALPLGGFVSFAGEHDRTRPGGYAALRAPARLAIIAAGPVANILVAIGLFAGILAAKGETTLLPVVSVVVPGSAADTASLQVGDRISAVDGTRVTTFAELAPLLREHPGQLVELQVNRDHTVIDVSARLGARSAGGVLVGYLGIVSHTIGHRPLTLRQIALYAPARAWHITVETLSGIGTAVTTGQGVSHFAGMLGVAHIAGEAAATGTTQLVALTAILSINLALMNLLPIPVLDGGAFLFCLVEWVRGQPAPESVQDFATRTGAAAIAGLVALSTLHDLAGFGLFQWLAGL